MRAGKRNERYAWLIIFMFGLLSVVAAADALRRKCLLPCLRCATWACGTSNC